MKSVLVSIVTYNSSTTIAGCLESLQAQTCRDFLVVIADNASADDTIEKIQRFEAEVLKNRSNLGFCVAHNQVIERFPSDYILVLNPDLQLAPAFLEQLLSGIGRNEAIGTACGKLLRLRNGERTSIVDCAGMVLRPNQRHLDRGAGEIDHGQYDAPGFVFGATGAAVLYRRTFLEDVRQSTGFFDSNFFAFREDADLSWRGQWLGWKCLYWPAAVGWHKRRVTPERRRRLPPEINYHSVKNRFLMRIKNLDGKNYARHFASITLRDIAVAGYTLLLEWSSLPAFAFVARHYRKYRILRRELMQRRRATPNQVGEWFMKEIELL
ncbi:MAG TPA: glycosyltransferase family 2 protein [Acidobacteriota bacterium]|jgi:GT2 family glycosyltransferase